MYTLAYKCDLVSFFFNDTATTEIYTLSLHDALPICTRSTATGSVTARASRSAQLPDSPSSPSPNSCARAATGSTPRSEGHTSELQSRQYLVCRLLLEKKQKPYPISIIHSRYIRPIRP